MIGGIAVYSVFKIICDAYFPFGKLYDKENF